MTGVQTCALPICYELLAGSNVIVNEPLAIWAIKFMLLGIRSWLNFVIFLLVSLPLIGLY